MRKIKDYIGWVLILIFIIGVMVIVYRLYFMMTDEIRTLVNITDQEEQSQRIQSLVTEVTIWTLTELITGVIACVLLIVGRKDSSNENIVYVEKFVGDHNSSKSNEGTEGDTEEHTLDRDKILKDIEEKLNEADSYKDKVSALMSILSKSMDFSSAAFYKAISSGTSRKLDFITGFAFRMPESGKLTYEFGEGLVGQAALESKTLNINNVPEGYITIHSGLGEITPKHLIICPLLSDAGKVVAVIEAASLKPIPIDAEDIFRNSVGLLPEPKNSET